MPSRAWYLPPWLRRDIACRCCCLGVLQQDGHVCGIKLGDVEDGIVELADKIGISDGFDFSQPGQERKLLLAYCLYGWNNALDDFERNYASDILQARERWEVDRYGSEGEGQGL